MDKLTCAFLGRIGLPELILILVIILLLFGAKKLPEIAKSLGIGLREFKKSVNDITSDTQENAKPEENSDAASKPDASAKHNKG
ncbi:MAG: twin-arginine translocase TatA/TatE family subunit [Candidatus Auribacterota bacterium]|jgi:sec-independent protein translocase protein TatA|nr:twin-arginine translocase TatA/TatE family subunit [Candidatus Auribacterota bacterium]